MSQIKIDIDPKSKPNQLIFDIQGSFETGLDKSIVNSLRRVLLSSIPTVAFRTKINQSDLLIKKNNTSLHNEFISDRIGLIPLYINPITYQKQYLFHLHVENNPNEPLTTITAKEFDIYPLRKGVDPNSIDELNISDYDKEKKLSQKEKASLFRPFKFKGDEDYCIITELKSTKSSMKQELEIYGVPSVSFAYEDAKWQAVSCATYSFKRDEKLFEKVLNEKIQINNIAKSNQKKYRKELWISESERYFHRDINSQPYWYSFKIDSVHFMDSKELFIHSNQIIIDHLQKLIDEFPKISTGEKSILTLDSIEDGIYRININGSDDTIGNVIQSHISNHMINDKSILSICGYKKIHPLEDIISFTMSLNKNNKVFQINKPNQVIAIIEELNEACNSLIQIYSLIKAEADKSLKLIK